MNGPPYMTQQMTKEKYIVMQLADKRFVVGRCFVGEEDKFKSIATTTNLHYATLVMNALAEYDGRHRT